MSESKCGVRLGLAAALLAVWQAAPAQQVREYKDVVYATLDKGEALGLDLYVPGAARQPALIVWVHGGAWSAGSKTQYPRQFVEHGFAVASVDFRQTTQAPFPANVHDIKSAVRFLRANADKYGYASERIAIAGASSGGHLASLVGVTGGVPELEGSVGGNFDQSSRVQAVIAYFGAANLTTILAQSTPFGLGVRRPALERLFGKPPEAAPDLARLASPVFHIDSADPPLLLFHGDQDPQMPINQSHELEGAYEKFGLDVTFHVLHGAAHGGEVFLTGEGLEQAVAFLRRTIEQPSPASVRKSNAAK
jgi:acetyl esterase/lipase